MDNTDGSSIDSGFTVHPDMKGHTRGSMTFGEGSIYGTPTQQKTNSRSSTEAELIGVNDVMPHFQGYDTTENIISQESQSAMLLQKNEKGLGTSKRTKQIDIRYFFDTDQVVSNGISIEYYPTGDMTTNFFIKSLQGSLFKNI
jgi:hypothetical protein